MEITRGWEDENEGNGQERGARDGAIKVRRGSTGGLRGNWHLGTP